MSQLTMFEQQYASVEEKRFSFYCNELLEGGWLLKATYQPKSFMLTEDAKVHVYVRKKNGNDMTYVKLLNGSEYTADWELLWSPKADGVFTWKEGGVYNKGFYPYSKLHHENFIPFFSVGNRSFVDVKGSFAAQGNSSAITFPVKQKMLMQQGIFVQKAVLSLDDKSLFYRTFTPRDIIRDEVYRKDYKKDGVVHEAGTSKLKFTPTLIEKFIKHGTN